MLRLREERERLLPLPLGLPLRAMWLPDRATIQPYSLRDRPAVPAPLPDSRGYNVIWSLRRL